MGLLYGRLWVVEWANLVNLLCEQYDADPDGWGLPEVVTLFQEVLAAWVAEVHRVGNPALRETDETGSGGGHDEELTDHAGKLARFHQRLCRLHVQGVSEPGERPSSPLRSYLPISVCLHINSFLASTMCQHMLHLSLIHI